MMNYLVSVFSENYQGKEVYEQVVYNVDTPELAIECLKAMMIAMGDEDVVNNCVFRAIETAQ